MRLARIPNTVEAAASRLRKLDQTKTEPHRQNALQCAFSGGLGPKVRNQAVEDLATVLEAVLGRPPTISEVMAGFDGPEAA